MTPKPSPPIDERAVASGSPGPPGFLYHPDFLPADEATALLRECAALEYAHDIVRGQRLRRGYVQFGSAYVTTGRRLTPAPPMPASLAALAARVAGHGPAGTRFDQCIITFYPPGAGIGWHADAPCFGDCIAAVSLGHPARLQFRPAGQKTASHEVLTAAGSLYVMRGAARWAFQHQVCPVKGERYSITFRCVAGTADTPDQ